MSFPIRQTLCIELPTELHGSFEGAQAFTENVLRNLLQCMKSDPHVATHPDCTINDARYSHDHLLQRGTAQLNSMLNIGNFAGGTQRLSLAIIPADNFFQPTPELALECAVNPDFIASVEKTYKGVNSLNPDKWDGFELYQDLPPMRNVSLLAVQAIESEMDGMHRKFRENIGCLPSDFVSPNFLKRLVEVQSFVKANGVYPSDDMERYKLDQQCLVALVQQTALNMGLEARRELDSTFTFATGSIRSQDLPPKPWPTAFTSFLPRTVEPTYSTGLER